jgi:hypothetical protein
MPKCHYCKVRIGEGKTDCSICGINISKAKRDLTKDEKKIIYYCRAIRVAGVVSIIFGVLSLLMSVVGLFIQDLRDARLLFLFILGIIDIYFGLSLRVYKKWCFFGSIPILGYGLIISIIYVNLFGLIFSIILLSYVLNSTSKKILFRQLGKDN